MTPVETIPEGKVVAVCADHKHRFSKAPRLSIRLIAGHGIEGDVHAGPFVKHRFLARRNPRTQPPTGPSHCGRTAPGIARGRPPRRTRRTRREHYHRRHRPRDATTGYRTPDRRRDAAPDRITDAVRADRQVSKWAEGASDRPAAATAVSGRGDGHRNRWGHRRAGRRHPGHPAASASTGAPCHLKAGFDRLAASPDRPVGSLLLSADRSA
jgi:hypothetical protein